MKTPNTTSESQEVRAESNASNLLEASNFVMKDLRSFLGDGFKESKALDFMAITASPDQEIAGQLLISSQTTFNPDPSLEIHTTCF